MWSVAICVYDNDDDKRHIHVGVWDGVVYLIRYSRDYSDDTGYLRVFTLRSDGAWQEYWSHGWDTLGEVEVIYRRLLTVPPDIFRMEDIL